MATKRRDRSRKKSDNVRFLIIRPKPSGRMKLPDQLFDPERTGRTRRVRVLVTHEGRLPGGRLRLNPWDWG